MMNSIEERIEKIIAENNMTEDEALLFLNNFAIELSERLGGALDDLVKKNLFNQYMAEAEPLKDNTWELIKVRKRYRALGLRI